MIEAAPLTLALSPRAGRGDLANATCRVAVAGAAYPFSPFDGEKVAAAG